MCPIYLRKNNKKVINKIKKQEQQSVVVTVLLSFISYPSDHTTLIYCQCDADRQHIA